MEETDQPSNPIDMGNEDVKRRKKKEEGTCYGSEVFTVYVCSMRVGEGMRTFGAMKRV